MEIPSDHSGKVVEVFVNSGEEVSTGQKLMTIETDESITEKQSKKDKEVESKIRTEEIVLPDPVTITETIKEKELVMPRVDSTEVVSIAEIATKTAAKPTKL